MSKEMKNHIKEGYPVFKETKPDLLDNLFKGFADALNGIVWQDDALISYCKEIYKIYGEHPGIQLEVEDLWYAESY